MLPILAEVLPPPEVFVPAGAAVEAAIAGLVGALAAAIPWWRHALADAVKWVVGIAMTPLHELRDWVQGLNVAVGALHGYVTNEVGGLVQAVAHSATTTVVNVTGDVSGRVAALQAQIQGAEGYAISVSEDLYNRAVSHADQAAAAAVGAAAGFVDQVVGQTQGALSNLAGQVGTLFDTAEADLAQVRTDAYQAMHQAYADAVAYTDAIVGPIPGEIADLKPWAQGAMALVGAEVFAKVITTVQSLYDPCCEFATDQVKPSWDKVKNLLGKLTSRGPLALVVLGAASEVVVALDRPTIVAMLKQARAEDHGTSLAVLQDWRRPGVA